MNRLSVALGLFLSSLAATPSAQDATARFDVASVKQVPPGGTDMRPGSPDPGGRWLSQNATLEMILRRAYPDYASPGLIVGPRWIKERRFDIDARAGRDAARAELLVMLRNLLADRFRLKVRVEPRPVDVYALVIAREDRRLGPRMRQASAECIGEIKKEAAKPRPCDSRTQMLPTGIVRVTGGRELSSLVAGLQTWMDKRIIDQTGLTGPFEMDLEFDFTTVQSVGTSEPAPNGVSIFTALQEQLGLKLDARRETMDVLVIESVEMPSTN
jgi:uncharacterized protein (TIGR03435 family)